jgi:adenylate cyclase
MTDRPAPAPGDDEWRRILIGEASGFRRGRSVLKHLPSGPRCKLCASPFRAPTGPVMRLIGKGPYPKNPKYCSMCFSYMTGHHGGAEVECSLLFADVRGSTPLAENLGPGRFRAQMDRFFDVAGRILVNHDAIVDKFVGDEVIGIFIPALTHGQHAARAVAAARALLLGLGYGTPEGPWLPVGAGVHTGVAYVGAIGSESHVDLTAMGDPVNVAARLASAAGAGEILVTLSAAEAAGLEHGGLERRDLALKGKSESTPVVVLTA